MLGLASFACAGGVGRGTDGVVTGLAAGTILGDAVSTVLTLSFSVFTATDVGELDAGFVAPAGLDEADVVGVGLTEGSLAGTEAVATGATDGQRCP